MGKSNSIIGYFARFVQDSQMYPTHISLYVALFQLWGRNRFQTPFSICRKDAMELSSIKSFATYHKCIKEIHNAGFIIYSPNYNSYKGSLIEIIDFETLDKQKVNIEKYPVLIPNSEVVFIKPELDEIELYFNERDLPSEEAKQFYSAYQSKDWKLCNNNPMRCWRSAARMWISKLKIST
ncbi:hypothetical protein P2W68_01540 [Chryseobacterium arthrosphaerae]|uniref:hypothetical protein n=1 Tax=Chryseobacterium arthrosphaerae TaxID=651561 RepID=UPI0023E27A6B|nr:hypothetical protein [Chryseobacterium arthrosphaerae]WES98307.1 hypothetical protein P2W68_01540 [Chryseobacterium arthrosphaerae]